MQHSKLVRKRIEAIFFIILGTVIMTAGTILFNIPMNIAAGGVTGFAQVISSIIPWLNLGTVMITLNIIVLIAGYIVLGKEFGIYTVIGSVSYSAFIAVFSSIIHLQEPILEDNIANLVLGAVLIGLGLAIVFRQNGSTGGTDVIAKIIEKKTSMSVSRAMLAVDAFVIVFAGFVYGVQSGIYAFISIYVTAFVLDRVIAGFNSKIQMTIISDHIDQINSFIHKEIQRGTTYYMAKGGYTLKDKFILVTVVDQKQYIKIRNYIDSIDVEAFVYISNINSVVGYGFSKEASVVSIGENTGLSD